MMCIVWSVREDLGEHLVDLYIMFVKYLLDHLEQKMSILKRTPQNVILDKYEDLLMNVASLANNWDVFNRFKTIMSYSDLEECLGRNLQFGIDLGCLVKYNPSSNLAESDWMFTHLSLQELAYYLANIEDEREINKYINKCSTIEKIQKQNVVLSFLVGLNVTKANRIIQKIVKSFRD